MRAQEPGRDHHAPQQPTRLAPTTGHLPAPTPRTLSPHHILALQRAIGNRAVTAMLATRRAAQQAHDEPARRTAETQASGEQAQLPLPDGPVHRAAPTPLQRAAHTPPPTAPLQRTTTHNLLRSPGQALSTPLRTEMEARLGADFSGVRLHTGATAQCSAAELGARAYTSGEHIVIGAGGADKHTLAHELTHVIQQRQGPVAGRDNGDGLRVSDPSDRFERAAEASAARVMAGPVPKDTGHPEQEHNHTHAPGHRGPADATAVQRAVGFEFEASWNVRSITDGSANVLHQRLRHRKLLINARILDAFLAPYSPYHTRLSEAEREQVKGDRGAALRAQWLAPNGLLTPVGQARYDALAVTAAERALLTKSLLDRGEVPEEPLEGENLGKGRVDGLVVKGTQFDLTADASPTGGSNLEWVTDPLKSLAEVDSVMDDVTAMAAYLDSRVNDTYIPSEHVTAGHGVPQPNLRIYPDGKPLSLAPQVTFGATMEQLSTLIKYLERRVPMNVKERIPLIRKKPVQGRDQAATDLSASGLGELPAARTGAKRAIQALLPRLGFTPPETDVRTLTGLVMHLAAYLLQGQRIKQGDNAKTIAGALMARTDFAHAYSLLPTNLRGHFQANAAEFTDLVLDAASMNGTGNAPVFANPVERGLANDRTQTTITLTRSAWLNGITVGQDLLKHWDHLTMPERGMVDQASAEGVHKSLGALGSEQNLVGPQNDQEAVVSELRRMKDNLRAAEMKSLAIAVFSLVEQLNANEDLAYRK
ncbi:DUF4157 domain-containing protein [Streptomyces hirsutus]|uniref:DUF4157 domain-containing protein n=1 Tax=Streptomyces hirsutus TaxID=35620 RepID=UPI0036360BEA